jgi:hypothetical protein
MISCMFPANMWNVLGPFQPCFSMMCHNLLGVHHKYMISEWTLWRIATTTKVVTTSVNDLHVRTCPWNNSIELLMELIVQAIHNNPPSTFISFSYEFKHCVTFPKELVVGDLLWTLRKVDFWGMHLTFFFIEYDIIFFTHVHCLCHLWEFLSVSGYPFW